jgi:hypothetical protein
VKSERPGIRGLDAGVAALALDRFEERCLVPADVRAGSFLISTSNEKDEPRIESPRRPAARASSIAFCMRRIESAYSARM